MDEAKIPDDIRERIDEYDRNLDRWTYYEILYITRNASRSDLKKSYYKLVQLMHPDRYGYNLDPEYKDKLERIFNEINIAYNILSNESSRMKYDQSLYYAEDHGQPIKQNTDKQVAIAQYKRGIQAMSNKEVLPAIEFFRSAVQLDSDNSEYYAKLAIALSNHPNPRIKREAFDACREAIKRNHENANYHALMGKLHQKLDEYDLAEVNYRRALSWDPNHHLARKELKVIAQELSKKPQNKLKSKLLKIFKPRKSDNSPSTKKS
ncbi:DnaJ domain-containing protein [bacterium]|nr:DnaJ domain-containing protein [candidate division CSSED10-310 bacterium]